MAIIYTTPPPAKSDRPESTSLLSAIFGSIVGGLAVLDLGEFEGFSPGDVRNYVTSALQLAITGLSQAVRL